MNVVKSAFLRYTAIVPFLFMLNVNSAMAASTTNYCPYSSTSQCSAWLSGTDPAFEWANNRYWPYVGFINPHGVLNIELKPLPTVNKIHLFKDNRTLQNTFDTSYINTYTKVTYKYYYDTRLSRMEFLVHDNGNVYHVMLRAESDVRRSDGKWISSENCIIIDGISDCYKTKNGGWVW